MKITVTGFDPFGGESVNPSFEAVKLLPDRIGDTQITKLEIPTSFVRARESIRNIVINDRPDFLVMVGQAGGRNAVTPERVAINCCDAKIPDNDGDKRHDEVIYENAPAAYFSTLPIRKIEQSITALGIKSAVSNTAGTFVCNSVMYEALHTIKTENIPTKAGFIHVPYIPEQTAGKENMPSMEISDIIKALTAAILALNQNF